MDRLCSGIGWAIVTHQSSRIEDVKHTDLINKVQVGSNRSAYILDETIEPIIIAHIFDLSELLQQTRLILNIDSMPVVRAFDNLLDLDEDGESMQLSPVFEVCKLD